jgi:hypothetical protein
MLLVTLSQGLYVWDALYQVNVAHFYQLQHNNLFGNMSCGITLGKSYFINHGYNK